MKCKINKINTYMYVFSHRNDFTASIETPFFTFYVSFLRSLQVRMKYTYVYMYIIAGVAICKIYQNCVLLVLKDKDFSAHHLSRIPRAPFDPKKIL